MIGIDEMALISEETPAMDRIEKYREIVLQVFREHTEVPVAHDDIQDEIIVDREADRYLWMASGWRTRTGSRVHGCIARIDIIDGKLWIQYDGTEGIAPDLERYGVPKDHIVLGFRSPDVRQYTGYAVE